MRIAKETKLGLFWWMVSLVSALALWLFALTRVAVGL